ncbi:MAG: MFS transporter [Clostridia bacterium]|nr:MFS transporter [Clostridia bacterium]
MARAGSNRGPRRSQVQTTNRITGERRWWALAAVMICMFFSSLNQTTVSTAMPTIISALQGFNLYAWAFTAYILASSVTIPLYGKLSDMYGRKPFYVFGLLVFLLGAALAGRAHSMAMLVAARLVQGVGGGAMMSMPRATIGDIFNPRERGRWIGLTMGVFGLATIIGPGVGGWITDHLGWRWVFYVNMPVAALALAMVVYALPTVRTETRRHVDFLGSLLLVAALVPMLLGVTWGGTTYAWSDWRVIGLFSGSALMLALFVWNERRAPEPVIDMRIFANPIFSSVMVISLAVSMTMFGAMLFLPLFVQGALGISAESAGYILTPMMLSFIAASIVAGQVMSRTGRYKALTVAGGCLLVAGAYLLTRLDARTAQLTVVRDMVVLGLGIGSLMPVMGTVIQNAFPYRMLGTVNATQQAANSLGGAVAAPILGTVLANRFAAELPRHLPAELKALLAKMPPAQAQAFRDPQGLVSAQGQAAVHARFAAFGPHGEALYQGFIHAVRETLAASMSGIFWTALAFAAVALLGVLLLPEVPLRRDEFYRETDQETEPRRAGAEAASAVRPSAPVMRSPTPAMQPSAPARELAPPAPGGGMGSRGAGGGEDDRPGRHPGG